MANHDLIPWEARKNNKQYTRILQQPYSYKVVHSNGHTNNNNVSFSYGGLLNFKARIGIRQG